jgi:hypothetical protein
MAVSDPHAAVAGLEGRGSGLYGVWEDGEPSQSPKYLGLLGVDIDVDGQVGCTSVHVTGVWY